MEEGDNTVRSNSPHPPSSSFVSHISLAFSLRLARSLTGRDGMGVSWVMCCLFFFPLRFLLLSPCSAYLFLDLSFPFAVPFIFIFLPTATLFPALVSFFCCSSYIFHSLPREMRSISKRWDVERRKRKCQTVCSGLDYHNMLQYFSISCSIFNSLSFLHLCLCF